METSTELLWDLLGVIVAVLAIGYGYFKWSYQYWNKKNVPQLEPKVPFGNMPNPLVRLIGPGEVFTKIYAQAKSNGWKHCGIYSLARPSYLPIDLELIKHIMAKDFSHFVDRGLYVNEKDDPISAHLFAIGGKKWRNLRVKLTPTFTSGKLKMMFQTLVDCGLVMEDYIEKNVTCTDPVDIKEILSRFSTDIIGSCAFGIECNSFKDPDSPFRENSKKLFTRSPLGALRVSLAGSYPKLGKALGIRTVNKNASDFYTKVVEDTVNYRLNNNYRKSAILCPAEVTLPA